MENFSAITFILFMSIISFSADIFSAVVMMVLLAGYLMINRHVKEYFRTSHNIEQQKDDKNGSS